MDVETLLDSIFEDYKDKAILKGRETVEVEKRLNIIRGEVEEKIRLATDDFVGRPANDSTAANMRLAIIRELNKFLDTDITVDSIQLESDTVSIGMSYRPKYLSEVVVHGSVTAIGADPVQHIISHSL